MKVLIILSFAVLGVFGQYHGNGQPRCQTEAELDRLWRNNWDPTRFWVCPALNQPGISVRCADETAFMDNLQRCVPWSEWVWTEPLDPSAPEIDDNDEDNQEEITKISCGTPACTADQVNVLWPASDPTAFYKCPFVNIRHRFACPASLRFDFRQQKCVWAHEWVDVCA